MGNDQAKIPVEAGFEIWYRRVDNAGIPLLTLHGGLSTGHDYLEPLEGLATDRAVWSFVADTTPTKFTMRLPPKAGPSGSGLVR
jgi:hypothetical protein